MIGFLDAEEEITATLPWVESMELALSQFTIAFTLARRIFITVINGGHSLEKLTVNSKNKTATPSA